MASGAPGRRDDRLAWRNLVADWHLRQQVPLVCGCDDDTADAEFCKASVAAADKADEMQTVQTVEEKK